jgi:NADH:ubiquinone oxidoreductase subunit 5 (subunit L)/multisubunit Na+/H+ antiporter MnhA subunit
MAEIILDNISLILLIPLWLFLIIMAGRFFSVYVNKVIIYFLTLLSSLLGMVVSSVALIHVTNPVEIVYPFIKVNNFVIHFGLQADRQSLIFAVILYGISFAVQLFAISYMKDESKNYRFFALLNLFNFSMAGLLFSPNLFQMYVFWELVGVVSYFLIGFDYKNIIKSDAAKRVFLVNRIGDTALMAGIILVSYFMYVYSENPDFAGLFFEDLNSISILLSVDASSLGYCIICILFILAAAVKSAQFPFHIWLQDAMEAKIPVSALLHSATMVTAGVFLVIKLMPMLTLYPKLLLILVIIGFVTALLCAAFACIENHPKKLLAYSTSANIGLIFLAIGLGNISAALVFLTAHAIIKSSLFMLIPKDDKKLSYANFVLVIIFALSLAGILFSGLCGKELMYFSVEYILPYKLFFLLISFMTAFYITKFSIILYRKSVMTKNINIAEFIPLILLVFANIIFYLPFRGLYNLSEPFAAAIGGTCLALLLLKNNLYENLQVPQLIQKLSYEFIPAWYKGFTLFCEKIETNILSNYKPVIFISKLAVGFVGWIEKNIMDGAVQTTARFMKTISKTDKLMQKHNVQNYNLYAFWTITLIFVLIICCYKFLLM